MLDPEAITQVADILHPETFYISHHQTLFKAMLALYNQGTPTDLMQVADYLSSNNLLDKIGGKRKLVQLVDRTVSAVNIDAVAHLVLDKYQSRELISAGNQIVEMGYDESKSVSDRLNDAESKVFQIGDRNRRGLGLEATNNIAADLWTDMEQGVAPALSTGFYDLNDMLGGGLYPGAVYVVCAVPGGGKSAFANKIAYDIAKKHQVPAAIFSMEMPKKQIVNRFLSDETGIPIKRLKSRSLQANEWDAYAQGIADISAIKLHIDDTTDISATEIVARTRRLKSQYGELGCVVVDYLQLMVGESNEGNRNLELAGISRRFKLMAMDLHVPVIVLSQLNRNMETRSNKRPTLGDIRDTGALAQDADAVLGLYRDVIYNPDTIDKEIVEVGVIKQRDGSLGTIKLLFDGEFIRWRNLSNGI